MVQCVYWMYFYVLLYFKVKKKIFVQVSDCYNSSFLRFEKVF